MEIDLVSRSLSGNIRFLTGSKRSGSAPRRGLGDGRGWGFFFVSFDISSTAHNSPKATSRWHFKQNLMRKSWCLDLFQFVSLCFTFHCNMGHTSLQPFVLSRPATVFVSEARGYWYQRSDNITNWIDRFIQQKSGLSVQHVPSKPTAASKLPSGLGGKDSPDKNDGPGDPFISPRAQVGLQTYNNMKTKMKYTNTQIFLNLHPDAGCLCPDPFWRHGLFHEQWPCALPLQK